MKRFIILAAVAALVSGVSCNSDTPEDPVAGDPVFSFKEMDTSGDTHEIEDLNLQFTAYNGSFRVEANGKWEIKKSDETADWLTVNPMSGDGGEPVSVSAKMNSGFEVRNVTLEFYMGETMMGFLPVEQLGKDVSFSVTPDGYKAASKGETFTLTVLTNLPEWDYAIEPYDGWLTLKSRTATSSVETVLEFEASPNKTFQQTNSATVTFSSEAAPDFSKEVELTQDKYRPSSKEGMDGLRIAWDYSTIATPLGGYPRVKLLSDGRLAGVYESSGGSIKFSSDKGKTWGTRATALASGTFTGTSGNVTCSAANPELIELSDGTLIYGVNYRPSTANNGKGVNYSIAVSRSTDKGVTWSSAQVIYQAKDVFADGCWEPAFLQLPNGNVQCYFANEGIYTTNNDQNISFMTSTDKGVTWTGPTIASYAAGLRDGMPVPVIIGDEIVVSIEDSRSWFKPYTVRTKITDNWAGGYVPRDSPNRDNSLVKKLSDYYYQGAPYLAAVPGGTVMSYQTTEGRDKNDALAAMAVVVGDATARNFDRETRPFVVPTTSSALWNSLCYIGDNTIMAATSYGGRIIKGYLLNDLKAESKNIEVDGIIDESEWGTDLPIFIGHKSAVSVRAAAGCSADRLYLCARISAAPAVYTDVISFYIDTKNTCYMVPHTGVYRIDIPAAGDPVIYAGFEGKWEEAELPEMVYSKTAGSVEISIPFSSIDNAAKETMRLGMGFTYTPAGTDAYTEYAANVDPNAPYTWFKLGF